MTRQIVLDTETTGLSPENGDRLIEIGCVELIDRKLTGNNLHLYINPQRMVDKEAIEIHGITNEFLVDKPIFTEVVDQIVDYLKGAELVIHNAAFDVGFLNYELKNYTRADAFLNIDEYCTVTDTLAMARKQHPGQRNSLDALCKRYDIDNTHRELHGALLDAELLANVYLAMTGGQRTLSFDHGQQTHNADIGTSTSRIKRDGLHLLVQKANEAELKAHQQYMAMLADNH